MNLSEDSGNRLVTLRFNGGRQNEIDEDIKMSLLSCHPLYDIPNHIYDDPVFNTLLCFTKIRNMVNKLFSRIEEVLLRYFW